MRCSFKKQTILFFLISLFVFHLDAVAQSDFGKLSDERDKILSYISENEKGLEKIKSEDLLRVRQDDGSFIWTKRADFIQELELKVLTGYLKADEAEALAYDAALESKNIKDKVKEKINAKKDRLSEIEKLLGHTPLVDLASQLLSEWKVYYKDDQGRKNEATFNITEVNSGNTFKGLATYPAPPWSNSYETFNYDLIGTVYTYDPNSEFGDIEYLNLSIVYTKGNFYSKWKAHFDGKTIKDGRWEFRVGEIWGTRNGTWNAIPK